MEVTALKTASQNYGENRINNTTSVSEKPAFMFDSMIKMQKSNESEKRI